MRVFSEVCVCVCVGVGVCLVKCVCAGVLFEATQVATAESDSELSPEEKINSILPMFRVSTHTRPVFGTHTATQDGVYEIVFDNTYSR